tara:strand:+ start:2055 stop:2768 length:714 start_codon:yes stop_codon:yes gene_type:complete
MKIKFICGDRHVAKHFPPVPASKERPDWYNKLGGWLGEPMTSPPTVKKCMPIYDHITSGYIIYNPVEMEIHSGIRPSNSGEEEITAFQRRFPDAWENQEPQEGHMHEQCPIHVNEDERRDYITFSVPWRIETPPGYSCLIQPPYYQFEKRFTLFPGIVDTDVIDVPWSNWPGHMNTKAGEKVIIPPGTPIMQVLPFKRDEWEMETIVDEQNVKRDTSLKFFLTNAYARIFHKKKKFK